ncbi:MAG: hypothetical protein AAGA85_02905 [Bacteroidota bacterium]
MPVNSFVMDDWLQDFAYRTDPGFSAYLLSALIVMITSWVVLGGYSLHAVKANPGKTLRSE